MKLLDKIPIQNKYVKELLSDSFWTTTATVLSKGMLFLVWIVIARILAAEVYGKFSILRSTTLLFSEFVGFSLCIISSKFVAQYFKKDNKKLEAYVNSILIFGVILGVLLACILFFFSSIVSNSMLNAPDLDQYIKYTSCILFFSSYNYIQQGILRGLGAFKQIAITNFIQIILAFPIYVICTYYWNLNGAVIGYICHNLIICLINHIYVRILLKANQLEIRPYWNWNIIYHISRMALPYFFSTLIPTFAQWYNETVLISSSKKGFEEMGLYSVVCTIQSIVVASAVMLCIPFVSIMSKYQNDNNGNILRKLNFYIPIILSFFLSIPFMVLPELFEIIFGIQYSSKTTFLMVCIISLYTPICIYRQAVSRIVAVDEKQYLYFLDAVIFSILLILGFNFCEDKSALGLIKVFLSAYILDIILFIPFYLRAGIFKLDYWKNKIFIVSFLIFCLAFCSYVSLTNYLNIRVFLLFILYMAFCFNIILYIKK